MFSDLYFVLLCRPFFLTQIFCLFAIWASAFWWPASFSLVNSRWLHLNEFQMNKILLTHCKPINYTSMTRELKIMSCLKLLHETSVWCSHQNIHFTHKTTVIYTVIHVYSYFNLQLVLRILGSLTFCLNMNIILSGS